MPQSVQDAQTQIRQAYLAYRLNSRELIDLTQGLEQGRDVSQQLSDYVADAHDEKGAFSAADLAHSHQQLGLDTQFKALREDAVWSPSDRALYRRMSHPEYDATPFQNTPDEQGSSQFCQVVMGKFEDWDRNHDTRLTTEELDRAMGASDNTPEQAAALVVLRSRVNTLGACNPHDGNGVSSVDISIFAEHGIPQAGIVTHKVNQEFQDLLERASQLPPAGPLLDEDFNPHHVNQAKLGSCVLLSTTAADRPAEEIRSMFSADDWGNHVVTFKNGEYEAVTEPTTAERLYHAHSDDGGRWPAVLEIAVGQYLARKLRPEDGSIRTAADGIPFEEAFELMDGNPGEKVGLDDLTLAQARQTVKGLQGSKICGSRPELGPRHPDQELEFLHNGIENSHCYSLLKYDDKADEVTLRNPWNRKLWVHSEGQPQGGVFTMPFPQFYASFRWVAHTVPE